MKHLALTATLVLCLLAATVSAAEVSTDKLDYSPEEVVLVSGSGFQASAPVAITVTRPDGETGTVFGETDADGAFADVAYQLDGICGSYQAVATDGVNEASVIFTDSTCIYSQICSHNSDCTGAASGSKWYYDNDGTGSCSGCWSGGHNHCKYKESVCADDDRTDGVPNIGGAVRVSGAECDQDSDCADEIPQDACMDAPSCEEQCGDNCMCLWWCYWNGDGDEDEFADDYYDYVPDCDGSCECGYKLNIIIDDERCTPPSAPEFPVAAATAPAIASIALLFAYRSSRKN